MQRYRNCAAESLLHPQPQLLTLMAKSWRLMAVLIRGCECWQRLLLCFVADLLDEFDIKAEGLQLADQHVERFRHAGLDGCLALDDGLVDLGAAEYVVGLGGEQLLQDVGGAVGFERPNLHLAEALATELRLAAQRLLGDKRVRP